MDATAVTPEIVQAIPEWLQYVITAISALVTTMLVPFLHRKAEAARLEGVKHVYDANLSRAEQRKLVSDRLKSFVLRHAAIFAEQRFPALARKIKAGGFVGVNKEVIIEQIKAEMRVWGADLKKEAIDYFNGQGIDLVAEIGDKYLDDFVRWAADRVSPFPGRETAVAILQDNATDWLLEKGVDYLRNKMNSNAHGNPTN
jgi:hypothetical protein